MSDKPKVVILRETVSESIRSDLFTAVTFVGLIGAGWLIGSGAMQWFGGILAAIVVISRAAGMGKRMTIAEARAYLDSLERAGATHRNEP